MAGDIDELKRAVEGLRSEIKSFLATYNSNNVEIRQGLISSERWQAAHERLDEERWEGIKEKLHELKGMLETIPIKVEEDIAALRSAIDAHDRTLFQLKGIWLAVSIAVPAAFTLFEFYLHGKG